MPALCEAPDPEADHDADDRGDHERKQRPVIMWRGCRRMARGTDIDLHARRRLRGTSRNPAAGRGMLKKYRQLTVSPRKYALRPRVWIHNHRYLRRCVEKVFVNEQIVAGKKDPEAGLTVVPADDLFVWGNSFSSTRWT